MVKSIVITFIEFLSSEEQYINLTDWANGEGFDADINGKQISLTWDQWHRLRQGVKKL
jgi:hypothetical protein